MNKLKKIGSGLLAVVLSLALVGPALAAKTNHPKDPSGILMSWDNLGVEAARIEATTTASLLASGAGLLFGVCTWTNYASAAVAEQQVQAFASSGATGISLASAELALSPLIYSVLASAAVGQGNVGCWTPKFPVHFADGLVGVQSSANQSSIFLYRLFSSVNP